MLEDIQYRSPKMTAPKGRYKRRFIDDFPPCNIDYNSPTVEQRQSPGANQSIRFCYGRSGYDQDVATPKRVLQLLRTGDSLDKRRLHLSDFSADCRHPHAESVCSVRDFPPDCPQTNDGHSPSTQAPWPYIACKLILDPLPFALRSEERRVGKECRSRW